MPDNILSCDKSASGSGGRVPFLDHRLVELAFNIPSEINLLKIKIKVYLKIFFLIKYHCLLLKEQKKDSMHQCMIGVKIGKKNEKRNI